MFYTIYKTTNNINGKFYIGKHQTKDLNDGYLGSGKLLLRAMKKYGVQNFTKEILHIFDTEEEMNAKEKELVVISEMSYNLCDGGHGGFGYINKSQLNGINGGIRTDPSAAGKKTPTKFKKGMKKIANSWSFPKNNTIWLGRKHSIETIEKMKHSQKNKQRGVNNSQYGTIWITDGVVNKKIQKSEVIPPGWIAGRKLK